MAAITSTQAGNWSAAGTWTGGVVPGVGDTVTISHAVAVNTNTTVGTSPADTTTLVLDVAAAGSLTVAAGVTLTVRGNARVVNTTLTLNAGASYIFDSSAAAGTPIYSLTFGSGASQPNGRLVCNGTSAAYCKFDIAAGSGRGRMQRNASASAQVDATYTDFNNLGDAANTSMDWSAASGGIIRFTYCRIGLIANGSNALGRWTTSSAADSDFILNFNNIRYGTAHASEAARFTFTAATTGLRQFRNNIQNIRAWGGSVALAMNFAGSLKGLSVRDNVLGRMGLSATITDTQPWAEWTNNFYYMRGIAASWPLAIAHPGSTLLDNIIYTEGTGTQALNAINASMPTALTGTFGIQGNIYQAYVNSEDGDFVSNSSTAWPAGSNVVLNITRNLVLPNARGRASGSVNSHDSALVKRLIDFNTLMTDANGGTGVAAVYTGATYWGGPSHLDSIRSNLVWCNRSTGVTGQAQVARQATLTSPETGTAAAASTSTLINCAGLTPVATLPTTANQTLASSQATIIFTSGALAGQSRTITANTGSSVTVGVAFSGAPTVGDAFRIVVPDILNAAQVGWNGLFNVENGTLFDQNGASGIADKGYHNYSQTTRATIGQSDVDLGSGTYDGNNGPRFVDWTRNVETSWNRIFGQASGATWVLSASYVVGDLVSRQAAAVYGNAVITYRCISAHTSSTANRPADGTDGTWQTVWEPAVLQFLRDAVVAGTTFTDATVGVTNVSAVKYLLEWVKAGFRPRNTTLRTAAHDGSSIGAIALASPLSATCPVHRTAVVGVAFNQQMTASGGALPYTYTVSAGSIPAGLSLNTSTGVVSGTPSATGTFALQVTDADGTVAGTTCAFTVNAALALSCPVISTGVVGVAFNQAVAASGGVAPYTYSVATGAVPAGLVLNAATGAVSGTPSAAGSFTIRVTDAQGNVAAGTCPFTVNPPVAQSRRGFSMIGIGPVGI
ncbi:MAG: Ig domain-containing protein [Acidobacteria bacterium]|nr:Ig domain-containing protein [Acidobacteriota bacterium]